MSSEEKRNPIEELAEEFMQRRRNGESPSPEDYARQYPDYADEIQDLFPTLEMMEHIRKDVVEPEMIESTPSTEVGQLLGDFQILREIGRGGMGVVYEAQQSSLGRRVALKVLSPSLQSKSKYLERFKREAKAAANLQHSNIVPVYGVAEENGLYFYVMQFIFGRGLDEVFEALRHHDGCERTSDHSISADGLANALATGQFCSQDSQRESTRRHDNFTKPEPVDATATLDWNGKTTFPSSMDNASQTTKQDFSKTKSSASAMDRRYYHRIAELGHQAADALAYAHRNGMLHRDIKPGNLLLDVFGNIWITDFGLVKMTGEEALTETGDIVGTLRYIAPECLRGQFDERSDVYGLGLTLHEMLAREKAFSAVSRGELTQQILEQGPSKLRHIPRDLSTVIQKATSLDPADRYQTASDFADDLGRFLGSQPIRARRSSALERIWSWSKRNHKLAAALATCLFLVLSGLISSLVFSYQLNEYAKERQSAFLAAETESNQAKRRFVDANIARAQTMAASESPGQRVKGLETIRESVDIARELDMGPVIMNELRTAAISCLANADIVPIKQWESNVSTGSFVAFDLQLDSYAVQPIDEGPIEVRKVSDQSIITKIDGKNYWGNKWISPNGRYLNLTTKNYRNHLYEVNTAKLIHDFAAQRNWQRSKVQFNQTSDKVALATDDGFVRVYSIGNVDPILEIKLEADSLLFGEPDELFVFRRKYSAPDSILDSFAKDQPMSFLRRLGNSMLSLLRTKVQPIAEIYSISTGKLTRTFEVAGKTRSATYGPNGLLGVVGTLEPSRRGKFAKTQTEPRVVIELFEGLSNQPIVQLSQSVNAAQDVLFDQSGRVLIVNLHNKFALYEVRTGNRLMVGPGVPKATDGRRIVFDQFGKFSMLELVLSDVYRGLATKKTHSGTQIDPHGEFLVSPDFDALRFFDLRTGALLAQVENYPCGFARIAPDGTSLFVITKKKGASRKLNRWPIQRNRHSVTIGPPERIVIADGFEPHHLAMDQCGKVVASEDTVRSKIGIRFLQQNRKSIVMDGPDKRPHTLMFVAVSNDLRWAATGTWYNNECAIYDLNQGKLVHKVVTGRSSVQFTRDSRYLVCGTGQVVEMGTWNERRIDMGNDRILFQFGFKHPPQSEFAFAALIGSFGKIAILNTHDFSTLATIQINNRSAAFLSGTSNDGRILIIDQFDNSKEFLSLLDIGRLRQKLKELDLDWDSAELPPEVTTKKNRELVLVEASQAKD